MNALELIRRKHAGGELSAAEIDWLVRGAVAGEVPDYQLSALLMAINYEHLSFEETVAFTRAFVESGEVIDLVGEPFMAPSAGGINASPTGKPIFVDKHSTGGVGDKVSLILLPLLASMGFRIAKMSGRALGFTGGTIDKLESIPGFRTDLSREEMLRVVDEVGCCIVEQSADLVPADKLFYALRDATDTVEEMGLIAASVMSKKIACGAPYIVLDVKCGSGAFFKNEQQATEFALLAVHLGQEFDRAVGCVITNMEQPMGQAIGNAIEVMEVIRFLTPSQWKESKPPAGLADVCSVVEKLAQVACTMAGVSSDDVRIAERAISGELLTRFTSWITAQGGSVSAFVERYRQVYQAEQGYELLSPHSGSVWRIDGSQLERTLHQFAGRTEVGQKIDHTAGLLLHAKPGSHVTTEDSLLTVFVADLERAMELRSELLRAYRFGLRNETPQLGNVIIKTVM